MRGTFEEQTVKKVEEIIYIQTEKYYTELLLQDKRYLNKKEACLYLGISYATAEKYIFSAIPELKFGKTSKFDKIDIDYWTEDNKIFKI